MCFTNYQLWQLEKYGNCLKDEDQIEEEERIISAAVIDFENEERLR
jgi:hypothetical protein